MAITAILRKEKFTFEDQHLLVKELLQKMDLSSRAYLVVRRQEILAEGDSIMDGEEVRIIPVITGG